MNTILASGPPANATKRFLTSSGTPPPSIMIHPFSGPAVCGFAIETKYPKRTLSSTLNLIMIVASRLSHPWGMRTQRNARLAQRPRHSFGNLRRAGSIAVDAQGLRVDCNFAAVAGDHYASLRDAQSLPRCFFRIAD